LFEDKAATDAVLTDSNIMTSSHGTRKVHAMTGRERMRRFDP